MKCQVYSQFTIQLIREQNGESGSERLFKSFWRDGSIITTDVVFLLPVAARWMDNWSRAISVEWKAG